MDHETALSQICTMLYQIRDLDRNLGFRITDQVIQRYVEFSQNGSEHLACPVCFFAEGRVSNLFPPRLSELDKYSTHFICEYCSAGIPITPASDRAAWPDLYRLSSGED